MNKSAVYDLNAKFYAECKRVKEETVSSVSKHLDGPRFIQKLRDQGATEYFVVYHCLYKLHNKDRLNEIIDDLVGASCPFTTKGTACQFLAEMLCR
jgi:hypothetical protein